MTHEAAAVPSEFRIWVDGRLSERFSRGLASVDQRDVEGGTVLHGAYVDEAHLQGILDRLRGLGIKVMRFEVAEKAPGAIAGARSLPSTSLEIEASEGAHDVHNG